jgi:hypothetical protein
MLNIKNNITQSRLNQSQNQDKNYCNPYQSIGLIPTHKQLQPTEPFKRLLIAISDRQLTTVLEILQRELGLENEQALLFLRRLQRCDCSVSSSLSGGEANA